MKKKNVHVNHVIHRSRARQFLRHRLQASGVHMIQVNPIQTIVRVIRKWWMVAHSRFEIVIGWRWIFCGEQPLLLMHHMPQNYLSWNGTQISAMAHGNVFCWLHAPQRLARNNRSQSNAKHCCSARCIDRILCWFSGCRKWKAMRWERDGRGYTGANGEYKMSDMGVGDVEHSLLPKVIILFRFKLSIKLTFNSCSTAAPAAVTNM